MNVNNPKLLSFVILMCFFISIRYFRKNDVSQTDYWQMGSALTGFVLSLNLMSAWNEHGEANFAFDVLETVEDDAPNLRRLLLVTEEIYTSRLNTREDGYNHSPVIKRSSDLTDILARDRKSRYVAMGEADWLRAVKVAKQLGCRGVSEMLEKIGRGELIVEQKAENGLKAAEQKTATLYVQPEVSSNDQGNLRNL